MSVTKKGILGEYKLYCLLNKGASATVYLSTLDGKDDKYIIKIFFDFYSDIARANEINVHRYLNTLVDQVEEGFVMRYKEGKDLFDICDKLSPQRCYLTIVKAAHRLKDMHSKGIAHLDIKPENIFVAEDGDVYLFDYGFTRAMDKEIAVKHKILLIGNEKEMGTPEYMAPEVICGEFTDGKAADVYSLGISMFYIMDDSFPFEGFAQRYLKNARTKDPKFPKNINYPSEIKDLVMAMIQKDPLNRPSLDLCIATIQKYIR